MGRSLTHIASKVDTGRKIGLNTFGIYTGKAVLSW